jgi:hypothetical protein
MSLSTVCTLRDNNLEKKKEKDKKKYCIEKNAKIQTYDTAGYSSATILF